MMSQTISNDYVSMINKKGSGYNIPVIVDAIVDAAITPMKNIVTAKKEQVAFFKKNLTDILKKQIDKA